MSQLQPSDILIVVFHTRQEPWEEIVQQGQFKTWVPLSIKQGYKISYCFGPIPSRRAKKLDRWIEDLRWHKGAKVSSLRNYINKILAKPFLNCIPKTYLSIYKGAPEGVNGIQLKMWDMYSTARWKQLAIFKHFLEKTECKYLVILTSAAYLNSEILRETLSKIEGKTIFAGPLIQKDSPAPFVSGAQVVVNREFAKLSIDNAALFPGDKLNDLGLSIAAERMGITPIELPTLNLSSVEEIENIDQDQIRNNYHFRLKSFKSGKRNDVELFLKLKEKIENIK